MKTDKNSNSLSLKLTALWAVSESGLGGVIHALKIPVSGLLLGSFAVIIITFLARENKRPFQAIMQATLLVLLVKAIASPHSPLPAYLAVSFQGLVGALIYSFLRPNYFSAILFGLLALLESAFQKLLVLFLLFGKDIWTAFEGFFKDLSKTFQFDALRELPMVLLGIYCLVYVAAGILAGYYAIQLPKLLTTEKEKLKGIDLKSIDLEEEKTIKKNGWLKWIYLALLFLFISSYFFLNEQAQKAYYIFFRTIVVLVMLYFIVSPTFKYFIQRWTKKTSIKDSGKFSNLMLLLPTIRTNLKLARKLAQSEVNLTKRAKKLIVIWMTLTLYADNQ